MMMMMIIIIIIIIRIKIIEKSIILHVSYLLTYLLTPWCTVLLEKLTGSQLVNKFPTFNETRRFITAFPSAHQQSLS